MDKWHTGEPTEEGLFIVAYANGELKLCNVRLNGRGELGGWFHCYDAIAHMKIELYKEANT